MKRLLLILAGILFISGAISAQTPAPITGSSSVCLGNLTTLSDATTGGSWSSSAPGVAYVNPATGAVSGLAAGVCNITYTVGTLYSTFVLTVRSLPVLTPDTMAGCVGNSATILSNPSAGGWVSSNPAIASVNFAGAVTFVAPGVTTISFTSSAGCVSTATVTVNPVPLPITGTGFVYSGTTTGLTDPSPGGNWITSNASIATVDASGTVTGVSAGLVLISYTIPSTGCAATLRMDVNPLPGTSDLYAWYPFCGDTTDHSGNGRDLYTFLGGPPVGARPVLTSDRYGTPNSAYYYDGGNGIMEYNTFFPNPGIPPDFTWSCWIYPSATPQSALILYNGNPNTDGYGFIINDGTAFPGGAGSVVSVFFAGVGQFLPVDLSVAPYSLHAWHNLVLVKNGNSYHFYVDDGPGAFFIATFNTPSIGSIFSLGGNPSGGAVGPVGFTGAIDDVAYITRQLTTVERLSIYNFNPDAIPFSLGPADTTICSDVIRLAPHPQTLGGDYTWTTFETGFGFVVSDTTDTAIYRYPIPGILGNTYALTISKPYGCAAADTITVFKSPIPVNLGPPLTYFCTGDTVTLTSFNPGSSFTWSTGDTTHSIRVTTTGTYYVTVDSIIHLGPGDSATCVGRDTVSLYASRVPIITMPSSVINCAGNPAQIFTHPDPGYTYLWSNGYFGDSSFLASSGTYWVQVTDSGCRRSDTGHAVIINEAVTLLNHDMAVCYGDPVTASASVNPAVTYQWTPTAGIPVSNLPSVIIHPDTSAEYYMIVSFPGCPNIVDSFHIDVQPIPSVNIGGNKNLCEGDTLHITAKVTPGWYTHYNYIWYPGNANLDTAADSGTVVYKAITRHDSEELVVKVFPPVFLTNPQDSLCFAMDSAAIYVHPSYFIRFDTSFAVCPGDSLQFMPVDTTTVPGMGIAGYHWSPGMYMDDSFAAQPWLHPITSETYRMIATSIYGCNDTQTVNVTVHPAALMNLGVGVVDSVIISPGQSYHVQPQTNCDNFLWFPPLGINSTGVSDPVVNPTTNTTYIVVATTEDGCVITDSIRIHVDPQVQIAIPNAFTPEGPVNSVFSIINRGDVGLNYFRVFDRWGNKVFETRNINDGWDGSYNGKPQPFGVYVYDLEAVTSAGVVIHREGNVTLLR